MSERREIRRQKSFLHGFIYFDKRCGVMSCLVRHLSDEGARIIFSEMVTIPERLICTFRSGTKPCVRACNGGAATESGLGFEATPVAAVSAQESELMQRIVQLETEITELKRTIKKLKRGQLDEEVEAA